MPSSRKQKQGKVKTGRDNESEPMQASSTQLSAKRLMPICEPYVKSEFQTSLRTHHRLRGIAGTQVRNPSRTIRVAIRRLPYGFSPCVG